MLKIKINTNYFSYRVDEKIVNRSKKVGGTEAT